ncbi:MAG: DUF1818 family protein [Leptolyngbya sp. SIO4C1]|nr:DUF1818 family protein [Leptolyngbya sp. SIO4C1]
MTQRQISEGEGWRIGWDEGAATFPGLLGGADWALELSSVEFDDFCRLAQQLAETMSAMAAELMESECLTCEQETSHIWLEAAGLPERYSLRFILLTGRRGEGGWPPAVVPALLQAIAQLKVF